MMFYHTVSVSFIEFFHAKMIYARVVVFSFLFFALYILRYFFFSLSLSPLLSRSYVYVIFSFSLSEFACVCVCVSAISCLAPWVSRSIDRLIA